MANAQRAKRFAYQALLLNVSNRLSSDNLRDLKHLVKEEFPANSLEIAAQGTDLFTLMQHKDLIGPENLGLLKQLLTLIDRADLVKVVSDFEDNDSLPDVGDGKLRVEADLSPVKLKAIAEEVGQDWKMLGRYLGLKEIDIQAIDHANSRDLHEAAYQTLIRWQDKHGDKATVRSLKKALTELKLMNIVHKFF